MEDYSTGLQGSCCNLDQGLVKGGPLVNLAAFWYIFLMIWGWVKLLQGAS